MAVKTALKNMKGGVGKSTLAANIAWEFATYPWNKSVLLVDLDPQFNCSQYTVGVDRITKVFESDRPTVWDIFEQFTSVPGHVPQALNVQETIFPVYASRNGGSVDFIPSRLELSQTLRNPTGKEQLLKLAIAQVEDKYDLIVIDCAPTESVLTTSAYHVADNILVPVRPEYLSTIGLPLLVNSLEEFGKRYPNDVPDLAGVVFNAISDYSPEEVTSRKEVSDLASHRGWYVFRSEVPYSRSFPKGAREGEPVFWTSYARTSVKRRFANFAKELADRIHMHA